VFLAVIVIIVVAVAGVGAYVLLSSSSSPSTSSTTAISTATSTAASTPQSTSSSVATLPTSSSSVASSLSSTTTSSTTSSASSSTSEGTSSVAYTCTTTYTTGGTAPDYTSQYIGIIQKFSAMEFKYSSTGSSGSQNGTFSYQVISSSGGIYSANFTLGSISENESITATVDANNDTVLSVTLSGYTQTGSAAKGFFDDIMAVFGLSLTYSTESSAYTNNAYFHSTGTSSMTFGSTTFDVTTWVANSLPLSFTSCGVTSSLTAFTLQFGTPPGTSLTFVTYIQVTETSPEAGSFTFQLVSMTEAS